MGIAVSLIGSAVPGRNGVPGRVVNNIDLFRELAPKRTPFRCLLASIFTPRSYKLKIEKLAETFFAKTGIVERGLLDDSTKQNPTNLLAKYAILNAFSSVKPVADIGEKSSAFDLSQTDGFIFTTNTPDTVFPVMGKEVAQELGISPRFYASNSMACAGVAGAIPVACTWLEKTECKNVLIVASDVTNKLMQPKTLANNPGQNVVFGSAAAVIFLTKVKGSGGFKVSNTILDIKAPDIVHRPSYTGETGVAKVLHELCGKDNDEKLKRFGFYESQTIADLIVQYLNSLDGEIPEHEKLILPQAPQRIVDRAINKNLPDGIKSIIEPHLIESAVSRHGVTGAPASLLAWDNAVKNDKIRPENAVTFFNVALSGVNCYCTYDPNLREEFVFYPQPAAVEPSENYQRHKETKLTLTERQKTLAF